MAVKSTARLVAARAGQRGRHQGRRPRDPRHRRHLRDDREGIQRARLFRSGDRRARLQGDGRRRRAHRRAQPRSDRALRLVALPARSQAQGPPAPHPHPDAVPLGHRRPHPVGGLRPRLLRRHSGRALRDHRARRPFSAYRAARRIRAPGFRLHRRTQRHERSIISPSIPIPTAWDDPHGYLRVDLPNRALDPKIAADLFHRYYDEYPAGRRAWPRPHGQRASPDRDLHVVDLGRQPVGAGAADQARAHPGARLSDRPPPRSAARAPRSSPPST